MILGKNVSIGTTRGQITMHMNTVASSLVSDYCVIDAIDDLDFGTYLESAVKISLPRTSKRAAASHDICAEHWGLRPDQARVTIQKTTQRGVHTISIPALSCKFRANNCMLCCKCIHHPASIQCSPKCLHKGIISPSK